METKNDNEASRRGSVAVSAHYAPHILRVEDDLLTFKGVLGEDETPRLYEHIHNQLDEGSFYLARCLFGDGHHKGVIGNWLAQGWRVSLVAPEESDEWLNSINVDSLSVLDVGLSGLDVSLVRQALQSGVSIFGYRHPQVEFKHISAALTAKSIPSSSALRIPRQVFLPDTETVDDLLASAIEEHIDSAFLIGKGTLSSGSRQGDFPHIVIARGRLKEALRAFALPSTGVVVSELIKTDCREANGEFHKVHFATLPGQTDSGAMYARLADQHYKIRNRVDLDRVQRTGWATFSEASFCLDHEWVTGYAGELPGLDDLPQILSVLDPLGSIVSVDLMVSDSYTYLLEVNHFGATFLDARFTGFRPMDDLPRRCIAQGPIDPLTQLRWFDRLIQRLDALYASGALLRCTTLYT